MESRKQQAVEKIVLSGRKRFAPSAMRFALYGQLSVVSSLSQGIGYTRFAQSVFFHSTLFSLRLAAFCSPSSVLDFLHPTPFLPFSSLRSALCA